MSRSDRPDGLAPGDVLGGYQLLTWLGTGGMGRVWTARRLLGPASQYVAIKTALEGLRGDQEFERIFLDEARIASAIVHPNVCAIYEMGIQRKLPYLVMEWVNGGTLYDILKASPERRIDWFCAAGIVAQICAGLHAAHELTDREGNAMQVVHRDVSPQNILISEQGYAKIADFGVARAKGQLHQPTQTGELKGKLGYMAPEQLTTRVFDRRADVFALGCVLFQATTGRRPFHGSDALETMYQLLETDCERPASLVPDYPPELEAITLKALAKNPSERYQSAEALAVALGQFLDHHGKLVTAQEISSLVSRTIGDAIERRVAELKRAAASIDTSGSPGGGNEALSAEPSDSLTSSSASHRTVGAAWESPHGLGAPRQRNLRRQVLLGAVLTVLGGSLVLWASRHASERALLAPSVPASSRTTMAPLLQLRIVANPPDAHLTLDDGPPATSPLIVTVPRSDAEHQVRASRSGYRDAQRIVVFDRSKELSMELEPLAPTDTSPPRKPQPSLARGTPSAHTMTRAVQPQDSPVGSVEPAAATPRKVSRSLDPRNPFSDP